MKPIYLAILVFSCLFFILLKKKKKTDSTSGVEKEYLEKGKQIAGATFAVLSGQLQAALQEGGVPEAIRYCNINAFPLVDSLSKVYEADIKRTALRLRNPGNAPTEAESSVLEAYAKKHGKGETLNPMVQFNDQDVAVFYAPILVNEFCLNCHGKIGETLSEANYELIKSRYPQDAATGYMAGDLRGMWRISFKNRPR